MNRGNRQKSLEPVREGTSFSDIVRREVFFVRNVAPGMRHTWLQITPLPTLVFDEFQSLGQELNVNIFVESDGVIRIDL